jgi:hypothetical protein
MNVVLVLLVAHKIRFCPPFLGCTAKSELALAVRLGLKKEAHAPISVLSSVPSNVNLHSIRFSLCSLEKIRLLVVLFFLVSECNFDIRLNFSLFFFSLPNAALKVLSRQGREARF